MLDISHILVCDTRIKQYGSKELIVQIQKIIEDLTEMLQQILSLSSTSKDVLSGPNELISYALLTSNEKFVLRLFSTLELAIKYLSVRCHYV